MDEGHENLWNIGETDAVFLGAGFSRCATAGRSPLMNDFFADLDDRKYWSLWKFLSECFDEPKTANVEEALLKLDQLCLVPLRRKDTFIDQCRNRQAEVRAELDGYILERLCDLPIPNDNWARGLLACASEDTTVITTNYDNVAERALSNRRGLRHRVADTNCHHCKMCRILNDECAFGGAVEEDEDFWRGSLLKLHGSIAWKMCSNPDCDTTQCLIPDNHCRVIKDASSCDCCGMGCGPVLVHPSMMKTFDRFRGLERMWGGAYDALAACKSVAFFGFSFPPSDTAIDQMIRYTLGRSSGDLKIAIVDIAPDKPLERLSDLLGKRKDKVIASPFQVPLDGRRPDWVQELP